MGVRVGFRIPRGYPCPSLIVAGIGGRVEKGRSMVNLGGEGQAIELSNIRTVGQGYEMVRYQVSKRVRTVLPVPRLFIVSFCQKLVVYSRRRSLMRSALVIMWPLSKLSTTFGPRICCSALVLPRRHLLRPFKGIINLFASPWRRGICFDF